MFLTRERRLQVDARRNRVAPPDHALPTYTTKFCTVGERRRHVKRPRPKFVGGPCWRDETGISRKYTGGRRGPEIGRTQWRRLSAPATSNRQSPGASGPRAPGSPATGGAQDRPATARDQRGQHGLRRCCCDHRGARHRHHRSLRVPRMVFAAQRLRNVRCHRVHGNCVKSFRLQGGDKWMCVATMERLLYCLGVGKLSAET